MRKKKEKKEGITQNTPYMKKKISETKGENLHIYVCTKSKLSSSAALWLSLALPTSKCYKILSSSLYVLVLYGA